MPSQARLGFDRAIDDAHLLCLRGAGKISQRQRRVQYHAALAASVAAWESYLEAVVREFFSEIADPLDLRFMAVHGLIEPRIEIDLKRFNTPNFDNARTLVYQSTGYDAINDWNWPARSLSVIATKTRVDEIVQVRHSFAHGLTMPSFSWNGGPSRPPRLTSTALRMVKGIFSHLVEATDRGLDVHIKGAYGKIRVWY